MSLQNLKDSIRENEYINYSQYSEYRINTSSLDDRQIYEVDENTIIWPIPGFTRTTRIGDGSFHNSVTIPIASIRNDNFNSAFDTPPFDWWADSYEDALQKYQLGELENEYEKVM